MPIAEGILLALAYLLVRREPRDMKLDCAAVAGLLAVGVGMIYPIYLPVVYSLFAGFALAVIAEAKRSAKEPSDDEQHHADPPYTALLVLGSIALLAGVLTWIVVSVVTADRFSETYQILPSKAETLRKSGRGLHRYLAFACRGGRRPKENVETLSRAGLDSPVRRRGKPGLLCCASDTSLLQRVQVHIPGRYLSVSVRGNRFGAPVPRRRMLGAARYSSPDRPPRGAVNSQSGRRKTNLDGPVAQARCKQFRPTPQFQRTFRETPTAGLLVVATDKLHLPTLTGRPLYAPPRTTKVHPGVDLTSSFILTRVRGYDEELVLSRQALVEDLLTASSKASRSAALNRIQVLGRPLVFVVERQAHGELLAWLEQQQMGLLLVEDTGLVAWLLEKNEGQKPSAPNASPAYGTMVFRLLTRASRSQSGPGNGPYGGATSRNARAQRFAAKVAQEFMT